VPVLPVIDLLIFLGWTAISVGAVLKAIYVTTSYRPTFLGLGPLDLLLVAGCFLLFAMALAARTWVKAHEPRLLASARRASVRGGNGAWGEGEGLPVEAPGADEASQAAPPAARAAGGGSPAR